MRKFSLLVALPVLGLLLAAPAWAAPPDGDGVVIWNSDYTLAAGEQISGNLVVIGGDVLLEADSTVQGSVVIWDGAADVRGTVEGSVLVSDGSIHLRETAWVDGDVVCSGDCALSRDDGAHVGGDVALGDAVGGLWRPGGVLAAWATGPGRMLGWMFRVTREVAGLLVVAAVAGLVALVWPQRTERVGRVLVAAPWRSLGLGVLTFGAASTLIVVLTLTVCLSPLAALTALTLGATTLFGWIVVGTVLGQRLLRNRPARDALHLAAGLGTAVVTLVVLGLQAFLCLAPFGWLAAIGLGCAGLGAVVLTWLGDRGAV